MHIKAGDEIIFEVEETKVVLSKKKPHINNLSKYVGFLSHLHGKRPDDIVNELRGDVSDYSNRRV